MPLTSFWLGSQFCECTVLLSEQTDGVDDNSALGAIEQIRVIRKVVPQGPHRQRHTGRPIDLL